MPRPFGLKTSELYGVLREAGVNLCGLSNRHFGFLVALGVTSLAVILI